MSNRLNIPDELASLIEKREHADRRQAGDDALSAADIQAQKDKAEQERRCGKDRRTEDQSK